MNSPKKPTAQDQERARLFEAARAAASKLNADDIAQLAQFVERKLAKELHAVENDLVRLHSDVIPIVETKSIWYGKPEERTENIQSKQRYHQTLVQWLNFMLAIHDAAMHVSAEQFAADVAEYFRGKRGAQ